MRGHVGGGSAGRGTVAGAKVNFVSEALPNPQGSYWTGDAR